MDHVPRLSEVLYAGLCCKIGTPTEVAIRRDVRDMEEMIQKPISMIRGFGTIMSGSYREGLRLKSSDRDMMIWPCNYKLITDISQFHSYNTSKHTTVLMEDFDTPPGFVRLRLLTSPRDSITRSSRIPFNNAFYISSSLWRENQFQFYMENKHFPQKKMTIHGPCASGFEGSVEFDHALCLPTIYWPKLFIGWMDRCQRHTWPPAPVLENILRKGCHCVPIGSKTVSTSTELEWRLSFSQAEQQLVCSMNHTQFMCYGLLKIFLKEVINYRKDPLLCSYFLKTTVFWIIQLGHIIWCPNNLLDCSWKCFKYIIHCVYRGVFPNFFISQNNMFKNKVVGGARESLLQQLYQYYRMGVGCLLYSPTLRLILEPALSSPLFVLSSTKGESIFIADEDMCAMFEIFTTPFLAENISVSILFLKSIDALSGEGLLISPYQSLTIQFCTAKTLIHLAFAIANSVSCCSHKKNYIIDRKICNMLQLAARLGPMSNLLYLASYYYRTGRYDKTLRITYFTKQKLSSDFIMYNGTIDRQKYSEAVGNLPLFKRMKKAWVTDMTEVDLFQNIPFIEELSLEQKVSQENAKPILVLSPIFMIEILSVLSHYRLGNTSQCLQSLTDLQTLLLYDDGKYVSLNLRDISWQILGICQHTVGDLHGALQSFKESLRQKPFHKIREATYIRIRCVKQQLYRNMQA
ncbi:uncharacterized protein LOC133174640 [Saccostrea echinata]|uniref:uncharacterized protein LOC133174640 n=1 Tax=Saccostrea echinata TaxID=191078 RepID=UPI002A7F74C7|nr:uncharacterized protein LOC133174640 [Saccostrea echinata]